MIHRYWINQPSTLQPLHSLHNCKVLADEKEVSKNKFCDVYFINGSTLLARVPSCCLSKGWNE